MKEDEIEKILFQFLCEFLDSAVKRFDLTDYEHRKALARYLDNNFYGCG